MVMLRSPVLLLWLLLAAPSLRLLWLATRPGADLDVLTADSGDWAAYFLVAALAITPLLRLVPALGRLRLVPALGRLRQQRRAIGLAAFGTGLVHLGLYVAAMGELAPILAEITAPGIWTGWAALALLLPLALTSHDAAMRALGRGWKRLQRLAYPAALLTLVHMALVHDAIGAALWLGLPLLALELTRLIPRRTRPQPQKASA
jgi:methionine sulfoxide reductase heme-binding subunit